MPKPKLVQPPSPPVETLNEWKKTMGKQTKQWLIS